MDTKDNFEAEIRELTKQSKEAESRSVAETETRKTVIDEFIDALGYETKNLSQVRLENTTDSGDKNNLKVDYTILKENASIIIVEAKPITKKLNEVDRIQLAGYFQNSRAEIAILTNGKQVIFYSHLEQTEKHSLWMDKKPFFEFNLQNIKVTDIEALQSFRRGEFNNEKAIENAIMLKYSKEVKEYLENQLNNPDEKFISLITSERKSIDDMVKNKEKKNNHKKQLIKDAIKFAATEITGKKTINENTSQPNNNHSNNTPKTKQENTTIHNISPEIQGTCLEKYYQPEYRKDIHKEPVKSILLKYTAELNNLGIEKHPIGKTCITYYTNKNYKKAFASIETNLEGIKLWLNITELDKISDDKGICEHIGDKGHLGIGKVFADITKDSDHDYIMGLVKQVYDQKA